MLYGERNQSVQQATESGAENNGGAESAEQRNGGKLREDNETGLYQCDAKTEQGGGAD